MTNESTTVKHGEQMRRIACLAVAISVLMVGAPSSSAISNLDPFTLIIRPIVGDDGKVTAIDVTERVNGATSDGRPLSFKAALSAVTTAHIADSIADLTFSDASGSVDTTTTDDTSAIDRFANRHWRLTRAVTYPLRVHYRMPVQDEALRGGPPFGLATAGEGVAGSGYAFLVLPENMRTDETRVRWDLSQLAPGSIGAFTSGEGDTVIKKPPQQMDGQWMVAGPATTSSALSTLGFHSYILGNPPVGREELARFGQQAYDTLTKTLPWLDRPNYRLIVRVRDGASFTTGTGTPDESAGALVTTGTDFHVGQDGAHLLNTVFHEMTHYWVGQLADDSTWFSEGLTVYLTAVLPCERRLMTPGSCAAQLNLFLHRYNKSEGHDWPQERIEASGFSSEEVRQVPYARGALYFAELNSRIMARSNGRRTIIDALGPAMTARAHGQPFTRARFETMLRHELGASAVADFHAKLIEGSAPIEPPSDAFGPCLERTTERFTDTETRMRYQGLIWRPAQSTRLGSCDPAGR